MNHDTMKAKIQSLVPELMHVPSYPYNPDAAKAIVALEKIAGKTLWNETIEKTATLMIENYRQQQVADYIAILENRYPGHPIQLHHVLKALQNKTLCIGVDINGQFLDCDDNLNNVTFSETCWNLTTDFDGQSNATKDFIGEFVGVIK